MYDDQDFALEGGGRAVLLLRDFSTPAESLRPLAEALHGKGLSVRMPALYEPGADWTAWLCAARAAFTVLRDTHVCASLCGFGSGIGSALLLAEAYSVDHLLLAPQAAARLSVSERFGLRALERRARRSLFALSCPAVILLPTGAETGVLRQARRLCRALGRCTLAEYPAAGLADTIAARLLSGDPEGADCAFSS